MSTVEMHGDGDARAVGFEVIAENLGFPEGPVAMDDGSLVFVDLRFGSLSRLDRTGKVSVVAMLGGSPNGAAIGPDGKCYVCNSGGFEWRHHPGRGWMVVGQAEDYSGGRIERIDLNTGKSEILYDRTPDGPLRGPNDLVFDTQGGFWFTDSGKMRATERDHGAICYARADGSMIERVVAPVTHPFPNGIGLSPDGNTLYYAETVTGRLWAFALKAPGVIDPVPFPSPHGGRLLGVAPGYRLLDSLAIEAGGNVCVGTLMRGGITVFDARGGVVEQVALPDLYVTNLCFGGSDMRDIFATMSSTGRIAKLRWPRAGLRLNFQG
jgi:gluconolactonase